MQIRTRAYGTTTFGGAGDFPGNGTVFSLTAPASPGGAWTETVLHSFTGTDGALPQGGVVIGRGGILYGTTGIGGTGECYTFEQGFGCGTVFALKP